MTRFFVACTLAVTLACGALAAATEEVRVMSLVRDGQVLVSFSLTNGFTEELRDAIRSGLPASITYEVELRRNGLLWFDPIVASSTVIASARLDNLTRQHHLTRTIDGRGEAPRVTESEDVVREWLTSFERLPLFSTAQLEPNAEYYVKVRAKSRPRTSGFLFWPWDQSVTGYHRFTFVQ